MSSNPSTGETRLTWLHYLVWAAIGMVSFLSMLKEDGAGRSALSAIINCTFYALIIYGNINFLYPRFYERKKYLYYFLGAAVLLLVAGLGRGYLGLVNRSPTFAAAPRVLELWDNITFLLSVTTVFILSFVFRLAMVYFRLKEQSKEILLQRSQFELRLLKAQVQPHFLFNTLNTMYYEAFIEAPKTALLIERLSDIMRYFIDQSIMEYVQLKTEVNFIDNYIALERIRMVPEPEIIFHREFDEQQRIPPMLLMTFVENIFKHGIDKITGNNKIYITLQQVGKELFFETKNLLNHHAGPKKGEGLGLANLRQRLTILYGSEFELYTGQDSDYFTARLKLPLS